MKGSPSNPLLMGVLSTFFRSIPTGARGKTRLARALLRNSQNSPALIRTRDGSGMVVANLQDPVGLGLWMDGVYEPETLQFLQENASSDSVLLDVGANIGAFTIPMAKRVARVIAVEPSPQVLPYLRQNIALNHLSNVELVEGAASTPDIASVPLYVPPENKFGMASSAPQFHVEPTTVRATSLDSIVAEHKVPRVSAMKIDTEGFEAHVLLGGHDLLRSASPPAIIFEFCDWAEERAFPGRAGWAQEVLMTAGYKVWLLPDYLRKGPPIQKPVSKGDYSIVGFPANRLPSWFAR